jgi:DNA-binding FadR family transcriptional regulator
LRTTHAKSAERRSKPGRIRAVLGALGHDIAREIIPAGAVLPPEHELASRFGVGRGVVREAIKTLSGKGLVSVGPRHGTRVLPRRDWSLLDRDVLNWLVGEDKPDRKLLLAVQEVRLIIEPAAAALAAARATAKERQRIHAALAAMEASHDQATQTAADKAFHLAIRRACSPGTSVVKVRSMRSGVCACVARRDLAQRPVAPPEREPGAIREALVASRSPSPVAKLAMDRRGSE